MTFLQLDLLLFRIVVIPWVVILARNTYIDFIWVSIGIVFISFNVEKYFSCFQEAV